MILAVSLAGWSLGSLGLLFGGGAAAITALYLLRMRRRQVVVPFAALWERVSVQSESRQLWRKLRRLMSWLLQLLLLGLVCLALGDPRPDVWLREPRTVALVVDVSASMAGPTEEGTAKDEDARRLGMALERAAAEIRSLGPADRALVIAAGEEVRVAAPLSGDASSLIPALMDLEPSYGEADLGRALALAEHAVAQGPGPEVLVLTDGAVSGSALDALERCTGEAEVPCRVAAVGGPTENVAITAFAARRYPNERDQVEVLAEVRNLGDTPNAVVLDIEAEGVSVGRRRLELQPGESKRELIPELDAARARLVAKLEPVADPPSGAISDLGLEFDDVAFAVVPPLNPLDVALISDGSNLFLEAALLTLGDHVRLSGVTPAQLGTAEGPDLDEADLAIFDVGEEPLPASLPGTHVVIFDPWRHDASPSPIAKKRDVQRPFLTEQARKHPILEDVVLKDVNIGRGTTFVAEPADAVLTRTLGEPIVVLREEEHSTLVLGFDPRQSDLPLRIAFPILVENIVRYVEQREPGFVASVKLGNARQLSLADLGLTPEGVTRVRVDGPGLVGASFPVEQGRFRLRALEPGFYRVTSEDGSSQGATVEVAVNQADLRTSDLHPSLDLEALPEHARAGAAPDPAPITQGPLWTLLLLVFAGIVTIEWITYHRRVTV